MMRRFSPFFSPSLLLCVLSASTGCSVYDPSLVQEPGGDAGVCGFTAPTRPSDTLDDDIGELTFALRDVELDQGSGWSQIGFDLDGVCTDAPDLEARCEPPSGSRPPEDGREGRDNVFGQFLFPLVNFAISGLEDSSREFQALGKGAVVIRIHGYNGERNDERVAVTMAVTIAGTTAEMAGVVSFDGLGNAMVPPAGDPPDMPAWDSEGTDVFWGRSDNFVGADQSMPRIFDDNAYVSNGFLVARLPAGADIIFPGEDAGLLISLTEALVVGRISDDYRQLQDVTVSGRWGLGALLDTASSVGACPGSENLMTLTNLLNDKADVRSLAGSGGPGVSCDAISVGIVMQGYRARWGGIDIGPPLADACAAP